MAAPRPISLDAGTDADVPLLDDDAPEARLADFFEKLDDADADQITLAVWELTDPNDLRKRSYLSALPAGETDAYKLLDAIRDEYGPGAYLVTAKRGTQFANQWRFNVGRPEAAATPARESPLMRRLRGEPPQPITPATPAPAAAPASSSDSGGDLRALLRQQTELLQQLVLRQQQPSGNTQTLHDFAGIIAMVREMFPQAPPAPTSNVIDIVRDVLKLKHELTDDDAGGDAFGGALKHLVPVLTKAIEKLDAPQPAARRPLPPQPEQPAPGAPNMPEQPKPATPNGFTEIEVPPEVARAFQSFVPYLPMLLQQARFNASVDEVSAMICAQLDTFDDAGFNDAVAFITHPHALNLLAGANIEVARFEGWFRSLVDTLVSDLQQADGDDETADPDSSRPDQGPADATGSEAT